jgi:hypothetical protein
MALLIDAKVGISDHVPHHAEERAVVGRRQVLREVFRADQHIATRREIAVVLSIDEQQIHTPIGRRTLQHVRDRHQERDTRCPIVRAGHRHCAISGVGRAVRNRSRVPVRDVQHSLRLGGLDPRENVPHRQRVAVRVHV